MRTSHYYPELHRSDRIGWLRASVLGANDGILSTASLLVGVASAQAEHSTLLLTGVAGLIAGSLSMAAGEYVSVSSQADTENADIAREKKELETNLHAERDELAQIYVGRGLDLDLANKVAHQLMEHDALGSHARDELGISVIHRARPLQAALASGLSFTLGAGLPLFVVVVMPMHLIATAITVAALFFLAVLGAVASLMGGAPVWRGVARVVFWGLLAMGVTSGIGSYLGTTL
jgi:vacuolar iron transporter family protein